MSAESFQAEIQTFHSRAGAQIVDLTSRLVTRHAEALASDFYSFMMQDENASHFLSHEQVKTRLHPSLANWLANLVAPDGPQQSEAIYAHQIKIGEVHARIDIPVSLVLRGARLLKDGYREILEQASEVSAEQHYASLRFFNALVDLTMEVMSHAYATSHERKTRSSEAYRLYSITENLSTEKERQKAAIFDWESKLLYEAMIGGGGYHLPKIHESEFGLWFQHKGMHAFQGVPETAVISEVMETIDTVCLPLLANPVTQRSRTDVVRDIRAHANNIQFQLANLFEKSLEVESGKDVLTRLLNRKFLPSIMQREVEFCRRQGKQFAVALIDIDYFKQINDTYGHASGDIVLQQVASVLNNRSRAGDFLFRMGGEEFLMVLVSIRPKAARNFFEQLRKTIASQRFLLTNDVNVNITVSIGLALYDGHPDYQYTLRKADEALYRAKSEGRNRLCVATDPE